MRNGKLNCPGTVLPWLAVLVMVAAPPLAFSRDGGVSASGLQRYVVEFTDPPLAMYDGRELSEPGRGRLPATMASLNGEPRLNVRSAQALAYLEYLAGRHRSFRAEAEAILGHGVEVSYDYRVATNGMAIVVSADEAAALARSPLVASIRPDREYRLETDAGPPWIGAGDIWSGASGFPANRGEGIVVGMIDSGINWDHPSFADPSPDGYHYTNPRGSQFGLCSDPEVQCNNKLIGVYDFVEDNPSTEDVVEENTKGKDNSGHGSHTSAIAAGNRVNVTVNGSVNTNLSGVAPRANIIAYRVCYIGDPPDPDGGGCIGSAILSAIDQAVTDGVDVINYSIGSADGDPWAPGSVSNAFLSARSAGIFVATSAGNAGPNPGTIGSPANAPWMMGVGNASHNRLFALSFDLAGGPSGLACVEGNGPALSASVGPESVVYAGDVGDPLGCSAFPSDSMTGAIALISRGDCLFATKAANAAAAGANFMVVYNNVAGPPILMSLSDSTISSCMISREQGIEARDHLLANPAASGTVEFPISRLTSDSFADVLNSSSSRGPAQAPVENVLKPNLIAPGTSILAASDEGQDFLYLTGTSMASPHVTGGAALVKAVHPDWSPSQIASAIEMTATAELATVDGRVATPAEVGAGRPQLGQAVNAGLYLDVTGSEFESADPSTGGDPGDLNLPGLVDSACTEACVFRRSVTDQMGGGSWTAVAEGFPQGVEVTVSPSDFTLTNGASRQLLVSVDVSKSGIVGEWVYGRIRLSAAGSSDEFMTVAAYSSGGDLPERWDISDDRNGGWVGFAVSGLVAMPDASIRSGGLVKPTETSKTLVEDPSNDDPYDGGEGVFTVWHALPEGGLWLYAKTLASVAEDVDLFVGRDDNGNQKPDENEELCRSTSPIEIEHCDLFDPEPGNYWILVQNWSGTNAEGDSVRLRSAAIAVNRDSSMAASGPGIVASNEAFDVRVSWDNLNALPGEEWLGAVGFGTDRNHPNNIGVVPVYFTRSAISSPQTFPLMAGTTHRLALDANSTHDRLFIDIPPGTDSLTVTASGADADQNDGLKIELRRLDFAAGLSDPPFATPAAGAQTVASAGGSGGHGPSLTINGGVQPGRWYPVLSNSNGTPSAVEIRAEVGEQVSAIPLHGGLWEPNSRLGLGQGFDYSEGGSSRVLIWYTYGEDGQPVWFYAGNSSVDGNIWTADLLRVTNDGAQQQVAPVGRVSVTTLAEDDALFSFTLFGQSGTDRFQPLSALTCPAGPASSFTGLWYRGVAGLGGASVLVNVTTQVQVHYLFDALGMPRWLFAQNTVNTEPSFEDLPFLQFHGYCAVCAKAPVDYDTVGMVTRRFDSETAGSWTIDFRFDPPLQGGVMRTDSIVKLTNTLECQ